MPRFLLEIPPARNRGRRPKWKGPAGGEIPDENFVCIGVLSPKPVIHVDNPERAKNVAQDVEQYHRVDSARYRYGNLFSGLPHTMAGDGEADLFEHALIVLATPGCLVEVKQLM